MDVLLFIVMVPFFLLLGVSWVLRLVNALGTSLMLRKAEKNADRFLELCKEYEAQGMDWTQAAYLASKETQQ